MLQEEDEEDEDEQLEQRLRRREQVGASSLLQLATASTPDLSVLADVALKMDPEADVDSEETETSDEAEEHKLEEDEGELFAPHPRLPLVDPEGMFIFQEHNYSKYPTLLTTSPLSSAQKRTKQDSTVLLPADLNQHGVQEAPEEVIGDPQVARGEAAELYKGLSVTGSVSGDVPQSLSPFTKKKGSVNREEELEKGKSKKRTKKDKENVEVQVTKRPKEEQSKKKRKGKLEVCVRQCSYCMSCIFLYLFIFSLEPQNDARIKA